MSDHVPLDTGDAIILSGIGTMVIRTQPANEVAVVLDLEGKLNKLDIVDAHRYLMSAGQAAELVAEIIVTATEAAAHGSDTGGTTFLAEFDRVLAQKRKERWSE